MRTGWVGFVEKSHTRNSKFVYLPCPNGPLQPMALLGAGVDSALTVGYQRVLTERAFAFPVDPVRTLLIPIKGWL